MRIGKVGSLLALSALVLAAPIPVPTAVDAQEASTGAVLKKEELDQLLAPIALYPDDLLTNVLVASTYPLEVVQAARWRKDPQNAKLAGDALVKALEAKDWDPSIKSLVQFPDVLQQMSDQLEWTQKLGDTFLAQQDQVMDAIQGLRAKADVAGNLKNTEQQKVTKQAGSGAAPVYIIQPANPEIIYVPVYEPAVVYGPWWYPTYPPYYWAHPGASFVNGFFWGVGIAVSQSIWGWGHCDWGRHDIDINVNKYNNINVNRPPINSGKWEHNPAHRGQVPYKNKDVRDKYKGNDRGPAGDKQFRGHDVSEIDRSKVQDRLKDTDHSKIKDKAGGPGDRVGGPGDKAGPGDKIKDRPGGGGNANLKDRPGDGGGAKIKDRPKPSAAERPSRPAAAPQKIQRDVRPQAPKSSRGALNVSRGADVRKQASRGHASRGGGGGGHRGGGRRG